MNEQEARKIAEKELKSPVGKLLLEDDAVFRFEVEAEKNGYVYTTAIDVFKKEKYAVVLPA
jgi:hypothetical protein